MMIGVVGPVGTGAGGNPWRRGGFRYRTLLPIPVAETIDAPPPEIFG
jgi:hypothetical protein